MTLSTRPRLITKTEIITLVALTIITLISQCDDFRFNWMLYEDDIYGEPAILEPREQGLSGAYIYEVLTHPTDVKKLIARSKTGNYLSLDRGESWTLITMDDNRYEELPIKWGPEGELTVLHSGVNSSSDGMHWITRERVDADQWETDLSKLSSASSNTKIQVDGVELRGALTRDLEGNAWVATARGVYDQPKGASTWSERNQGIHRPIITSLRMHQQDTHRVLALAQDGRVWLSTDFGSSWALIYEGDATHVRFGRSEKRDVLIINQDKSVLSYSRGGQIDTLLSQSELKRLSCEDSRTYLTSHSLKKELMKKLDCIHVRPAKDLKAIWDKSFDLEDHARYHLSRDLEVYANEPCDVGQNQDGTFWFYLCSGLDHDRQQVYLFRDEQWSSAQLDQVEAEPIRFHNTYTYDSGGNRIQYHREQTSADCELSYDSDQRTLWLSSTRDKEQRSQLEELFAHFGHYGSTPFTWLNNQTYTILGNKGLQVGTVSEECRPDLSVVWSWYTWHRETGVRYHHFNERIARWRLNDGEISLLLPATDGGLWGLKVPQVPPLSIHRSFKRLDEIGFMWWLWGLVLIYVRVTWKRRRALAYNSMLL